MIKDKVLAKLKQKGIATLVVGDLEEAISLTLEEFVKLIDERIDDYDKMILEAPYTSPECYIDNKIRLELTDLKAKIEGKIC